MPSGTAAFDAIKATPLKTKIVAKFKEIMVTYDAMVECFAAEIPEKTAMGIDFFLKISPLVREYSELIKQISDKALQGQLSGMLNPVLQNHKMIKIALEALASKKRDEAARLATTATGPTSSTAPPRPKPVSIAKQPKPVSPPAKPKAKPTSPTSAIKTFAKNVDANGWINQGKDLMENGDAEQAKQCFAKAIELAPWSADAMFYHGSAALETGDLQAAQKSLLAAIARYKKAIAKPAMQERAGVLQVMESRVESAGTMLKKIARTLHGQGEEKSTKPADAEPVAAESPKIDSSLEDVPEPGPATPPEAAIEPAESPAEGPSPGTEEPVEEPSNTEATDASTEADEPVVIESPEDLKPEESAVDLPDPNYSCGECGKFYRIKDPSIDLVYACSDCGAPLNRVFKCPHCQQHMALPQDQFKQVAGKEISCVYCNETFTP